MNDDIGNLIRELHRFQDIGDKENTIRTLLELSSKHYQNANYDKAELLLNDILKLNDNQENIYYSLALIEIQRRNFKKSNYYLTRELDINPENKNAKNLLSKLVINTNFPIMTIIFTLLNILTYVLLLGKNYSLISFSNLIKYSVSGFNINFVNLFTSLFVHSSLFHLATNILFLVMFGLILEKNIGSIKFAIIYLITGLVGNLAQVLIGTNDFTLGASGAIFGIIGVMMIMQPLLKMRVLGLFNAPIIIVLGIVFLLNTLVNIFVTNIGSTTQGDISHIIGLFMGTFLIILIDRNYINVFYKWISISMGFLIFNVVILNVIEAIREIGSLTIISSISIFGLFIIAVFLVLFPYTLLKEQERFVSE